MAVFDTTLGIPCSMHAIIFRSHEPCLQIGHFLKEEDRPKNCAHLALYLGYAINVGSTIKIPLVV